MTYIPTSKSFPIASIAYGYVYRTTFIGFILVNSHLFKHCSHDLTQVFMIIDVEKHQELAYKALIGVDVASKHGIDTSTKEQLLHRRLHPSRLILPLMRFIGIVPRCMYNTNQPRRFAPVHLPQIGLQPPKLVRTGFEIGIRPEHEHVNTTRFKRIIQIRTRTALLKRHNPSRIVGRKLLAMDDWDLLHFVVAVSHHPRPRTGQRLRQLSETVPGLLVGISVRQISRQ